MNIKQELEMTRLTVSKLLSDKRKMGRSEKTLRFQLMNLKKDMLNMKTSFVISKSKMKQKITMLIKENNKLKNDLKLFTGDGDYLSDENGVIDLSDDPPKTPEQPKKGGIVSCTPPVNKEKK